jgi:hypothetical protein
MAKTWFPHEDKLEDGEESKPLFGPKFSPFWLFAMLFMAAAFVMISWVSCSFIFSRPPS